MRNRHLRSTAVAQILDLVPSYLPGTAVSPHARELASQHYPEPCQTMRELRCCSLSPESRFSLSISHSHPLSSLTLLRVALFPLTASWVPPPASQLQCIARRRLVLARRRRLVPASLCNSPAHTLSTDDTISLSGSSTRHLSPRTPDHHQPAHRSESICAHKHMFTCAADFQCDAAKPPTSSAYHRDARQPIAVPKATPRHTPTTSRRCHGHQICLSHTNDIANVKLETPPAAEIECEILDSPSPQIHEVKVCMV
jgi:hypothetical protein